jgi:PQQ-like domain
MSDDFRNRLRLQLVEAAEREERRGVVARRFADTRRAVPPVSTGRLAMAAVVAAILALAIYELAALRPEPAAPVKPKVVVRFAPAASLGPLVHGFGSAWADDQARGQLLRIDPRTHRVLARIRAPGRAAISAGAGSIWALEGTQPGYELNGPLLRIDPRTNRVRARIPLRTPAGDRFAAWNVTAGDDAVWIVGPGGAFRLDTTANRVAKAIPFASGYDIGRAALAANDFWLLAGDRTLIRLDARTGARKATLRSPIAGNLAAAGNAIIVVGNAEVARLDPNSGHALWRTPLQTTEDNAVTVTRDLVWIPTAGSQLAAIDPLNGRVVSMTDLREFGATGLAAVGSDLWVSTAGGHIVVVRP